MTKAKTLAGVHTHTHTHVISLMKRIKGYKAFICEGIKGRLL